MVIIHFQSMWFYQVIPWYCCSDLYHLIFFWYHQSEIIAIPMSAFLSVWLHFVFCCVIVHLCSCVVLNFPSGMQEYLSRWTGTSSEPFCVWTHIHLHIKCVLTCMLQLTLKANLHNINVKQRVWVKSHRGSGILWPEATLHKPAATALDVTEHLCKAVNWIEKESVSCFATFCLVLQEKDSNILEKSNFLVLRVWPNFSCFQRNCQIVFHWCNNKT